MSAFLNESGSEIKSFQASSTLTPVKTKIGGAQGLFELIFTVCQLCI